jgi:hypothetical protein
MALGRGIEEDNSGSEYEVCEPYRVLLLLLLPDAVRRPHSTCAVALNLTP